MRKLLLIFCILGMGEIVLAQPYLPLSAGSGNALTGTLYGQAAVFNVGVGSSVKSVTRAGDYTFLSVNGDNNKEWGFMHSGNNLIIREPGIADVMTWKAGGNIGIGTNDPTQKLEITKNGTVYIGINGGDNIDATTGLLFKNAAGAKQAGISSYFGNMSFDVGSASAPIRAFTVLNTGNLGIGTETPAEKLSVNGKIRAKEIKVETGWADFVFKPDYSLRSLKETESFIKVNGHLPEIPSAEEVEANGINLGEMNSKLLQKIEELTLHLIQKDKILTEVLHRLEKVEKNK